MHFILRLFVVLLTFFPQTAKAEAASFADVVTSWRQARCASKGIHCTTEDGWGSFDIGLTLDFPPSLVMGSTFEARRNADITSDPIGNVDATMQLPAFRVWFLGGNASLGLALGITAAIDEFDLRLRRPYVEGEPREHTYSVTKESVSPIKALATIGVFQDLLIFSAFHYEVTNRGEPLVGLRHDRSRVEFAEGDSLGTGWVFTAGISPVSVTYLLSAFD